MNANQEKSVLTVASQNMLLDYTRTRKGLILAQDKRIGSLAATLAAFPNSFDVVAVQEAQETVRQHNGEVLSAALGYGDGHWVNHNQKPYPESPTGRPGEYMGLFGAAVEHAEAIELGDARRAICSMIDGVAFVSVHLRSGADARMKRRDQARALIEALDSYENAVILGDLNEPPVPHYAKARAELARAGFRSAFELTNQPHPLTSPIEPYKTAAADGRGWQGGFVRRGWSIDDIVVRGPRIRVLGAGVLARVVVPDRQADILPGVPLEGSDHDGIWARLELA